MTVKCKVLFIWIIVETRPLWTFPILACCENKFYFRKKKHFSARKKASHQHSCTFALSLSLSLSWGIFAIGTQREERVKRKGTKTHCRERVFASLLSRWNLFNRRKKNRIAHTLISKNYNVTCNNPPFSPNSFLYVNLVSVM